MSQQLHIAFQCKISMSWHHGWVHRAMFMAKFYVRNRTLYGKMVSFFHVLHPLRVQLPTMVKRLASLHYSLPHTRDSPLWKLKVILLHILITLLCSKHHITELPLSVGLIHAS